MNKISEFFASIGFEVNSKGLTKFNSDTSALEKRIISVRQQALKLNSELRKVGQARTGLKPLGVGKGGMSSAKSVANLNSSAQSGSAKIQYYTNKINRLNTAMTKLSATTAGVRLPSGNINIRGGNVATPSRRGGQRAGGNVNMFGSGAFMRNMLPFAGASIGAAVIMKTIRTGEKMLGSRIAINAVSGNPTTGAQNWDFINDLAQRLGTPLVESADQFAKISAAAQGTKLEGDPVRQIFEAVNEFGKARMVEPERLNLSIRAIGQMINKQQIMAEELKSQFGEHLPGAMQLAAKAMDKTVPELFKAVEAGEVMADDFLPKLAKVMKESAREGGALEKALRMSNSERQRAYNDIARLSANLFMAIDGTLGNFWRQIQTVVKTIDGAKFGEVLKMIFSPILLVARMLGHISKLFRITGKSGEDVTSIIAALIGVIGALGVTLGIAKLATMAYTFATSATAVALTGATVAALPMVGAMLALALILEHIFTIANNGGLGDLKIFKNFLSDILANIHNWIIDIYSLVDIFRDDSHYDKYRKRLSTDFDLNMGKGAAKWTKLDDRAFSPNNLSTVPNVPSDFGVNNNGASQQNIINQNIHADVDLNTMKQGAEMIVDAIPTIDVPK